MVVSIVDWFRLNCEGCLRTLRLVTDIYTSIIYIVVTSSLNVFTIHSQVSKIPFALVFVYKHVIIYQEYFVSESVNDNTLVYCFMSQVIVARSVTLVVTTGRN